MSDASTTLSVPRTSLFCTRAIYGVMWAGHDIPELMLQFYYIVYQRLALRFRHNYVAHILHAYKVTANILYLFQIII